MAWKAHSKADTLSFKAEAVLDNGAHNVPEMSLSQKSYTDRQQLASAIRICDEKLRSLASYIENRIALAEKV